MVCPKSTWEWEAAAAQGSLGLVLGPKKQCEASELENPLPWSC